MKSPTAVTRDDMTDLPINLGLGFQTEITSGLSVIRPQSVATRMELLTSTIRLVAADTFDIRSGIHEEDGRQH
jgi:hypothetical protein